MPQNKNKLIKGKVCKVFVFLHSVTGQSSSVFKTVRLNLMTTIRFNSTPLSAFTFEWRSSNFHL